MRFEELESRQLLSITLPTISAQTVYAGAPLNMVLDSSSGSGHVTYTATVSNVNLTNSGKLTATVPQSNPYLKLSITYAGDPSISSDDVSGDVVIQLFRDLVPNTVDKIMSLVNSDLYNGKTFHRIIENFMIQGGSGASDDKIDDEFNAALQFTSPGLLAMANGGPDTNTSGFFITTGLYRGGDFQYTILGRVIQGMDIVNRLDSVPTVDPANKNNAPVYAVTITDASIIQTTDANGDMQNGVLRLSASNGSTGTATVTIKAHDNSTGEEDTTSFTVNVAADTNNDSAFLGAIAPITLNANSTVNVQIPATDVENNSIYYKVGDSSDSTNLTASINSSTGLLTVTAKNGAYGVFSIKVSVYRTNPADPTSASSLWDTQTVPVYVNPLKPATVQLVAAFDNGSSNSDKVTSLNNSTGKKLQFLVDGVLAGALVEVFADGTLIGSGSVPTGSTSVTITTNGTFTLADGTRSITAKQTLEDRPVAIGNLSTTTDLTSAASSALQIKVDTTAPVFNFPVAPYAVVDVPYTCQLSVSEGTAAGVTYGLTTKPDGMTIDADTGLITWAPASSQVGNVTVKVKATDTADNEVEQEFTVTVLASNSAPVLGNATPDLGIAYVTLAKKIPLSDFVKNVTDADSSPVLGGIALVGMTGKGTWAYSLDGGTTFTNIGQIGGDKALLLPHDAVLQYTPNNLNTETATITYRAWDTTGGAPGGRVNLSAASATGGSTAYSSTTNTASLAVEGTCSISGYAFIDFDKDGRRITPSGYAHRSIQGVVVTLFEHKSTGWSTLASAMTNAKGEYSFDNLAAGVYLVRETQPVAFIKGSANRGTIAGKTRGITGGPNQFAVKLAFNEKAGEFNFGEFGLKFQHFDSRMLMPSAPRIESLLNTKPVVTLSQSSASTSSAVTYTSGGSPVNIAPSATIKDADNTTSNPAMLASMKVTLVTPPNGDSEELTVDTSGASITATYANNVLTLSGVASLSKYQALLRIVKYKNNASSPTLGQRTITATVFDGIAWSVDASTTLSVVSGS